MLNYFIYTYTILRHHGRVKASVIFALCSILYVVVFRFCVHRILVLMDTTGVVGY